MRRIQVGLLLLLVSVVVVEWFDWSNRHQQALNVVSPAVENKLEDGIELKDPESVEPLSYYSEVASRTLFREDRRGYQSEEAAPAADVAQPKIPEMRLMGIILTGEEKPVAVIMDTKQKKSQNLKVGDSLGQWVIKEIAADSITLSWQDQTAKVELRKY
ncbi:MAG: type II secretion system protein N [Candidatus Thiodiazotropha sp.]